MILLDLNKGLTTKSCSFRLKENRNENLQLLLEIMQLGLRGLLCEPILFVLCTRNYI